MSTDRVIDPVPTYTIPDKVAFDSRGIGWRWFNDVAGQEMFSMVPVSSDNDPMYEPLTWFVPETFAYRYWQRVNADNAEVAAKALYAYENHPGVMWDDQPESERQSRIAAMSVALTAAFGEEGTQPQ